VAGGARKTGPIIVDGNWQVLVRASKTSRTEPIDTSGNALAIPNPIKRPEGEKEPAILAVRELKGGRVALINQWNSFTYGAGTKWMYDREILEKGYNGKPSDMGRLLVNIYRWLAEPSLASEKVGGYITPPERLVPENLQAGPLEKHNRQMSGNVYEKQRIEQMAGGEKRLFRGLFGAKSSYSTGNGTVVEYAKAASEAGLDFLVFMDDFVELTPAAFDRLKADCKAASNDKLLVLAGYAITTNIGNHAFIYGPDPLWPPDNCLTGPKKSLFNVQPENDKGGYTGYISPYLGWVLQNYGGTDTHGNVGYYNFAGSGQGVKLKDQRCYSFVGLTYYHKGKLVEDLTEDLKLTALCTIPPVPVSINEVYSPEALKMEVKSGNALTYAAGPNVPGLWRASLWWSSQYDAFETFTSNGPVVKAWTSNDRVMTFANESFTDLRTGILSPCWVTSDVGLKEIRTYNGQTLYRRFLPGGAKEFKAVLALDATVQKNLVLVAEDTKGGQAVTAARRNNKCGLGIEYCGDHVNAGSMVSCHGPNHFGLTKPPELDLWTRGGGWDGGPLGRVPVMDEHSLPVVKTDLGDEDGQRTNQTPIMEVVDEGVLVVDSLHDEIVSVHRHLVHRVRVTSVLCGWFFCKVTILSFQQSAERRKIGVLCGGVEAFRLFIAQESPVS
jgi:hypothetical protein